MESSKLAYWRHGDELNIYLEGTHAAWASWCILSSAYPQLESSIEYGFCGQGLSIEISVEEGIHSLINVIISGTTRCLTVSVMLETAWKQRGDSGRISCTVM